MKNLATDETALGIPSFISPNVIESDYFFSDLNPVNQSQLSIVCGGFESCGESYSVKREDFDFFALEYIASGQCKLVLDENEFNLSAGSFFCYGPRTTHSIETTGQSTLSKFFVDLVGTDVSSLLSSFFLDEPSPRKIANLRIMNDLFFQLMDAGKNGKVNTQNTLELLIRLIVAQIEANAVSDIEFQSCSYQIYTRFMLYIEKHFKELRSISELSDMCCVTPEYLSRVIKRHSGKKPIDILTHYKLNHAAELMIKENLMVKEAGYAVGIDDPFYFSRLFKKHYGVSPTSFKYSLNR